MHTRHLVPWLGHLLAGLALFVGGLEAARLCWGSWEVVACALFASASGLAVIVRAEIRERPLRLLRKSRRSLTFPTQWAVKFNKSVPQGGVIPVAVIRSDGVRFVIDIQGHKEVEWNDPLLETGSLLVGPRGKQFKSDPAAPLMQAATAWGATAVLWLPDANEVRNLRQEGTNLIVVMGPARELKNALRGAEIVPIRQRDDSELQPPQRRRVPKEAAPMSQPQLQA
jgi:hypothetical protein